VVSRVRRALNVRRAGHTGTLDPMATGVLPVCVGEATKIAQFITEATKAYDATVRLGVVTDTLDAEGRVLDERPIPSISHERVEAALERFRGSFLQTPPMYSAVKVGGRRLYELARAGEEVERSPRPVTVYELTLRDFSATELQLSVHCSKGFFVRTLAAELGEVLGCGAHLSALRRTQSGPFTLAQAVSLADVEARGTAMADRLVPMSEALADLPSLVVTLAEAARVRHGGVVEVPAALQGLHRVLGPHQELLALAEAERGRLKYRRVLTRDG
jgi:tRNA pseudouridine55 synthase